MTTRLQRLIELEGEYWEACKGVREMPDREERYDFERARWAYMVALKEAAPDLLSVVRELADRADMHRECPVCGGRQLELGVHDHSPEDCPLAALTQEE